MAETKSTTRHSKFTDLNGKEFGRWTVLSKAPQRSGKTHWFCRCECGKERSVPATKLLTEKSRGCGCVRRRPLGIVCGKKHGMSRTAEYVAWQQIRGRCENNARKDFHRYGGRNIRVSEQWQSFEAFYDDMGPRPSSEHSIERRDNDGNYEKSNCYWATSKEQARNRRTSRLLTFKGETRCLTEWAEVVGLRPITLTSRLRLGWSVERALTAPVRHSSLKH